MDKSPTLLIEEAHRCLKPELKSIASFSLMSCLELDYARMAAITATHHKRPDEWSFEDLGLPATLERDQVQDMLLGRAVTIALNTSPGDIHRDFGLSERNHNA